jgi:hypothetical protein
MLEKPFLISDWNRVFFLHLEADPAVLAQYVPFELDRFEGRAYVSCVAFRMERFRLGAVPGVTPFPSHNFLNVRTYVRAGGIPAVYFLLEVIDSPLARVLAPLLYGLPYRLGRLTCQGLRGTAEYRGRNFSYEGELSGRGALPGALTRFLLERYVAVASKGLCFRVQHPPWSFEPVAPTILDDSFLDWTGTWAESATPIGAHYCRGLKGVKIGRPRRLR